MRRVCFPMLVSLVLLFSGVALGAAGTAGDGSLVVTGANAKLIVVQGRGLIFGHITQGTLTVVDYSPDDNNPPQVSGASYRLVGSTVRYTGSDIRFYFSSGRFTLRLEGAGIDISAVGKGTVTATGYGTIDDGTVAVNGNRPVPLDVVPTTMTFNGAKTPARP